jgi:hypothetical protein
MKNSCNLVIGALALAAAFSAYADVSKLPKHHKTTVSVANKKSTTASQHAVGSGVTMSFTMGAKPQVGVPLTIVLDMLGTNDAKAVLTAGQGLSLTPASQEVVLPAGQPMRHTITVVPQAEGLLYVNAFFKSNGRASSTAIPVQVGTADVQQKARSNTDGAVEIDTKGRRIISVPASSPP